MFRYTSMTPCQPQGTITLTRFHKYRMGIVKDAYGQEWHINGYAGGCAIATKKEKLSPYFYSTETNMSHSYSQEWLPYKIVYQTTL